MQRLLLALALVCAAQAIAVSPAMKALDIQKLAGPWHSVAMASSSIALLDSKEAAMRVFVKELRPVAKDALNITLARWVNHACEEQSLEAQQTQDPAVFRVDYCGERKISVLDTDYSSFLFFCMDAPASATACTSDSAAAAAVKPAMMCQCLARSLDAAANAQLVDKFSSYLKILPTATRIFLSLTPEREPCQA